MRQLKKTGLIPERFEHKLLPGLTGICGLVGKYGINIVKQTCFDPRAPIAVDAREPTNCRTAWRMSCNERQHEAMARGEEGPLSH